MVEKPDSKQLVEMMPVRRFVRMQYFDTKPQDVNRAVSQLMIGVYRYFSDLCDVACRDPVVRRAYAARRNAVASRPVEVAAGEREDKAVSDVTVEATRYLLDSFDDFESVKLRMLDGLGKGVAVAELDWRYKDGWWIPNPSLVLTRDLEWDVEGGIGIRPLNGPYIRVADHPNKFWSFIPSTQTGLVTDQGDFISVLYWWLFKKWGYKFWLQGAERFGNPFVFARLPGVADISVRKAMLQNLQDLTSDSVGVFDGEAMVDVIDAKMTGNANVWSEMVREFDRQIQIALVGSPDIFDAGENGSRSAVETRNDVRLESSEADAKQFWESFRRDVVRPFLMFNADKLGGEFAPPVIKTVFETHRDVQGMLAAISLGMPVTKNELRSAVGMGVVATDDGDEAIAPQRSEFVPQETPGVPKGSVGAPPAADVAPGADVQQSAFNGAQVASMLEIVKGVGAGEIERSTAVEMLIAAFPIDRPTAERIVGSGEVRAPEVAAPLPLSRRAHMLAAEAASVRQSALRTISASQTRAKQEPTSSSETPTKSPSKRRSKRRES